MAESVTQAFIDNLITFIADAETPESVTNEIVARIFDFLNKKYKELSIIPAKIDAEISDRTAADNAIRQTIQLIQDTLQQVKGTATAAKNKAESNEAAINTLLGKNATTAIESFNEVIAFLGGIKDDESLINLLSELKDADNNNSANITAVSEQLDLAKEELEGSIGEVTGDVAKVANDLSAYKVDVGIYPFAGSIPKAEHVSQKEAGTVWYAVQEGYFVTLTESGPSHSLLHNSHNDVGGEPHARPDIVYRCGTTFYRHDGSGLVELESSVLRAYITSVKNGAKNELFDLEERLPVFRFDFMVQSCSDVDPGEGIGTIWYVIDEKSFWVPYEDGRGYAEHLNNPNTRPPYHARQDAIFYCDGDLYRFDGEALVDWEPWKLREDVDDLNMALTATTNALNTRIDSHTTDTGIYPFDGTVATVDDIDTDTAVAGSVWFLEDDGYFVKVTDDGVDSNIPHNGPRKEHIPVKAKGGVLFRQDSQLFRFDGSSLVAITDDIDKVKRALFDDMWASINGTKLANDNYRMGADGKELTYAEALVRYERNEFICRWNRECRKISYDYYGRVSIGVRGCYNEATGFFELNGLTDITYEQAENILAVPRPGVGIGSMWFAGYNIRTHLPIYTSGTLAYYPFFAQYRIEVIALPDNTEIPNGLCYQGHNLHTVKGILKLTGSYFAAQSGKLENITVYCTKANVNYRFSDNPKLSFDSVKYMIDNTTVACTITFHPDVYAKLTGDTTNEAAAALTEEELAQWVAITEAAAAKNISFATV